MIRRLVADLNLPVRIEALPDRARGRTAWRCPAATRCLSAERALARARAAARRCTRPRAARADGERSAARLLARRARGDASPRGVEPEYLELVDPETLEPRQELDAEALLVVAARVGETRLIDNALLAPAPGHVHVNRSSRKELA